MLDQDDRDRLEMMAEGNPKWDLSPNDRAAIKAALAEVDGLRAEAKDVSDSWAENGHAYDDADRADKAAAEAQAELVPLRARAEEQQRQLRNANESLRDKNRALDAMHYVWCSGGCWDGAHRWHGGKVSEAVVSEAERNTKRLRTWFETAKHRLAEAPAGTQDETILHLRGIVDSGGEAKGDE